MNEVALKENIKIENLIYEIRGKQVMLDSDLAKLYECKNGTKVINQAVNRNIDRFPTDFYFQLTDISNNYGGVRKLPYVFLASILKTKVATKISISIMWTFVIMRKYISNDLIQVLIELVIKHLLLYY